jgi:hypothetical protein
MNRPEFSKIAVACHFMFNDDQQTLNDLIAVFEFPDPPGKMRSYLASLHALS